MQKKKIWLAIWVGLIALIIAGAWLWKSNYSQRDTSLSAIKKRGILVVGSDVPYGVMEFYGDKHKISGIDVDVAQEIASQLGVQLAFNDYDWDQIFPLVKSGQIDLAMSSITITPERQNEMLFSEHYFHGGQVIIVRIDNQEIKGISNLANQKIAVQEGTTSLNEAKKYTADESIIRYQSFDTSATGEGIINDLKKSKFEAIIVDYIQALDIIRNNADLKIVGVPFTKEVYGIATKIGNDSLIEKVNSILQRMEDDGTLKNIEDKWTAF